MKATDFTNIHLQYLSTQAEGELPASIEHDFETGRMVDHYFLTPSAEFWQDEGIRDLKGVAGLMFLQQPDGSWKILVNEVGMLKEVYYDFPDEEFRKMLENSHVILPGEPGFVPPKAGE